MKNSKNFMSEIGRFVSKNKFSIAIGAIAIGNGIGALKILSSTRKQTEVGLIELRDVYDPGKTMMDEFMAGIPRLVTQYQRTLLKRELTDEEVEEIERRIYFNNESMQDILAEMDLLK